MGKSFCFSSKKAFNYLVLMIWMHTILLSYIRAVIMRFPLIGAYPDLIIDVVYALFIVLSLKKFHITSKDIIFYFAVVILFFSEWFLFNKTAIYIEKYLVDFVIKIVPLYFVGVSLGSSEEKDNIISQMYVISVLTIIASILYQYFFGAPMDEVTSLYEGSMDLAYNLLPHCCLTAYYSIKRTSVWNVAVTCIAGFYLLMLGTRGSALIYLVLITVLLIMGRTSKWAIARIIVVFGAVSAFLASPWYDAALLWMYRNAQQFGLSVRIFDKLLSGSAASSVGRDTIRETLLNAISENPFVGYGIGGDRILASSYAHNIVIEIWVEFGVVIGTFILAIIVYTLVRGYFKAKSEKGLIMVLFFACFLKLFLSGSYLDERLLLFLIGLCIASVRNDKCESVS